MFAYSMSRLLINDSLHDYQTIANPELISSSEKLPKLHSDNVNLFGNTP